MRTWPLVGRGAELAELAALHGGPPPCGIVLAGPAGVGKTRLGEECLLHGQARGEVTLRAVGTRSARPVPLGAFSPILPSDPHAATADDVLRWARREIADRGAGERVTLMVDDAHLLDERSAALLFDVAVAGDACAIVTVRSGEPTPDAVTALWKDGLLPRLDLAPLGPAEIEELLTAVLGGQVDGATLQRLTDATEGNVLYLRELIEGARDQGALREQDGVWRLAGPFVVSPRLVELVGDRLAGLSEPERDVVEMLALGDSIGVRLLESVYGSKVLEQLERRGLLAVSRDGGRLDGRLAHPVYGEVIRAGLSPLRARRTYQELASLIERVGARRPEDQLRLATCWLEAGTVDRADAMRAAAQTARRRWDLDLATRLATAAAQSGAGFEARLLLAQLAFLQGQPLEAEAQFAALAEQVADDHERAAVALSRVDNLLVGLGRPDAALAVAAEARESIVSPRQQQAMAGREVSTLFMLGRTRDALAVLEPLVDSADGTNLVVFCTIGSMCLAQAGRPSEALELGARGRAAHLALGGPPTTFGTHVGLIGQIQALAEAGRLADAEELATTEYRRAIVTGAGEEQAGLAQMLGWVMLRRGRVVSAARYTAEAIALYRERGWKTHLGTTLVNLAAAHALGDRIDAAEAALAELDALGPLPGVGAALELESRAWVAIARGGSAAGAKLLRASAQLSEERGDLVYAAAAVHGMVRIDVDLAGAAARLASLGRSVEGPLMATRVAHAAAARDGDADGLQTASRRFEELGVWLFAAEASAAAAVRRRRDGDARAAASLERRAAALARRCEGVVTPALRAVDSQVLLTARELEVAGLAAAGQTNREIAERLSISVRTVETQLQRVYEKLGVRRRTDLPDALQLEDPRLAGLVRRACG